MTEGERERNGRRGEPAAVVVVAASPGDAHGLRRLLAEAPRDLGIAYVVVQRGGGACALDRLARATHLHVAEAADGEPVRAGRVHVAPRGVALELKEGALRVERPSDPDLLEAPADALLTSAALEFGERAVGVLLGGGAGDGRAGLRAIRARGGLAIAEPGRDGDEALQADVVRPIADVPALLARHLESDVEVDAAADEVEEDDARLIDVIHALKRATGFDPSLYKQSTVERRVRRRMGLVGAESLGAYARLLAESPAEPAALAKDLLISVTDFFRGPDAFEWLKRNVIHDVVRSRPAGEPLRVWVPGCATGEEAYTLALLCLECAAELGLEIHLQVFATDLDEDALRVARAGRYPKSALAHVPRARREAFFRTVDGGYQVETRLRERISFSRHNVATDPPFSRLDLLSCRNLLIYLRRDVQQRVMAAFHFALRPNAVLLLGGSEVPAVGPSLFRPLNASHRVYQRVGVGRASLPSFHAPVTPIPAPRAPQAAPARDAEADLAVRALLSACVPSAAVVDASHRILYLHGDLERYLEWPRGEMHQDLLRLLPADLRTRVRGGLYRALSEERPHEIRCRRESGEEVRIALAPHESAGGQILVVVAFETLPADAPPAPAIAPEEDSIVRRLADELASTKQDLATTIEELEASNEELRSSNEEATSTNEELQSTNEELEASSEELRSLNEELASVNDALKKKIEEIVAANDDTQNFFASTRLATLFFDEDLRLRRTTPEAARILRLGSADAGRSLEEVTRALKDDSLEASARRVLDELVPQESELRHGGMVYVRRVLPYRTEDNRIGGVVVTYSDVTQLSRAMEDLRRLERQQSAIATLGLDALRSTGDAQDFFQKVAQVVAQVLDVPLCKVLQLSPERSDLRLVAGVGWKSGLVGTTTIPAGARSQAGYTLGMTGPVIVADLRTESRFSGPALLLDHGVVSGLSCVIETPRGKWGVVGAHATAPREFREDEVAFLQQIANLLGYFAHSRHAHDALEAGERSLRLALDGAGMGSWSYSAATRAVQWDERLYELLGLPRGGDASLAHFLRTVDPGDRARVEADLARAVETGADLTTEFRVVAADGSPRWIARRGRRYDGPRGAPILLGVDCDVTPRKLAAIEAERSRERLRRTVALSDVGIAFCRPGGELVDANDALLGLIGLDRATYAERGLTWSDLALDGAPALAPAPAEGGAVQPRPLLLKGPGGEPLDVLFSAAQIDAAGEHVVFFVDVREMKRTERVLRQSEERTARSREELAATQQRLTEAMEAGSVGTWRIDLVEGRVERDERTNRILGDDPVPTEDSTAHPFRHFHEEDRLRAERAFEEAIATGGVFEVEGRIRRKDGAVRWVRARGRALHAANGRVIGASGALVDITDLKQAEARLQDLARRKDEFIAVLGHELRNPLSAISSCAWLLRQGDASPEEATSLYRMIGQQVDQMTHLLNDLLDLARVTRGQIRLELAPVPLAEALETAARSVAQLIEDREHQLVVRIEPETLSVRADAKRLEQIVVNLLTNAARYTDVGGRIELAARQVGDEVAIAVTDNGIGLAAKELDAIWEPFSQVRRGSGGLGIGLTLVRQLVERHGGRVQVKSDGPGLGSCFEVTLPAARGDEPPREATPAETLHSIKGSVLIVDDNDSTVYALSALLSRAGARVSTASTGAAALAAVERSRPDVVLLDIGLPDGSGFEVAQALRERCGDRVPYLIAITGFGDPSTRRHLKECFDEHVIKPIDHGRVFALIASATANRGAT